jgi:hypothetical protein
MAPLSEFASKILPRRVPFMICHRWQRHNGASSAMPQAAACARLKKTRRQAIFIRLLV